MSISKFIDGGVKRAEGKERRDFIAASFKKITIVDGYILEFGVGAGNSLRAIASLTDEKIYGFDSFEGLPENWTFTTHVIFAKGSFKYDPPKVKKNIELVHGWFKDSLPKWKEDHHGQISFLHIDSDLYSSCATILTELNNQIVLGTIILFDELLEYPYWEDGEWKALQEWQEQYDREVFQLGTNHTQASYRIIK